MKENKNILENKIEADTKSVGVQLPVIPPKNSFILGDCMDYLKLFPPNFFDLAIVDPPYGIGIDKWDIKPTEAYWNELFRISKNQIVWGGNYFNLPIKRGWIGWDKGIVKAGYLGKKDFDELELAWTSLDIKTRMIRFSDIGNMWGWNGNIKVDYNFKGKIHPTQKHIEIYRYLLKEFASVGDLILDTHVGSASSLIACTELGFDYIGFEKDEEYYTMAKSRLGRATRKYELFEAV